MIPICSICKHELNLAKEDVGYQYNDDTSIEILYCQHCGVVLSAKTQGEYDDRLEDLEKEFTVRIKGLEEKMMDEIKDLEQNILSMRMENLT